MASSIKSKNRRLILVQQIKLLSIQSLIPCSEIKAKQIHSSRKDSFAIKATFVNLEYITVIAFKMAL